MTAFVLGLILALLMILATVLDKAYQHIPSKELKRQARTGNQLAKALYKSSAYGLNARLLLGSVAVLSAALSFVLLSRSLTSWLAFLIVALLIWFDFLWLSSTHLTKFGARLGAMFSAPISRVLHYLHPLLERISQLAHAYYPFKAGTGLYDPNDIVELLEWQKHQPDNRIPDEQLEQAKQSLTFNNKLVQDALTPLSQVRTVRTDDTVGPVLIDGLHQSGHAYFPVYEGKSNRVIGTLALNDALAAAEKGGQVSDIMSHRVFYINEDFTLGQALQAFLKTKHDLFIVVNRFEDFAGVITIQDILAQLVSQPTDDKFEDYADIKAVALAGEPIMEPETETADSGSEELVEYPS